jgi:large subunit ribosomal protein L4
MVRSSAATPTIFPRRFVRWPASCAVGQGKSSDIIVVDSLKAAEAKTKALTGSLVEAGSDQCAVHRRRRVTRISALRPSNIPNVDVLPVQGINVYDILRRNKLVLSKDAVEALEERFK